MLHGGLKVLRLAGATSGLEVALQGAQVVEWIRDDARPVLFVSPNSGFAPGKAVRGGVPLIFPWFGPKAGDSAAPQHGFARARDWRLRGVAVVPGGECRVTLALEADDGTRGAWPHEFKAKFSACAGEDLRLTLEVRNSGTSAFSFEAALHTYFAVSDIRNVSVRGLENAVYIDKVAAGERQRAGDSPISFRGETDRVYLDTDATCTIDDPDWKRRIVIAKSGSRSTVVWNPWIDKARTMSDLGDPAWTGMLCVETANAADDARTLAPGEAHVLEARIAVEKD